MYSRRLISVVQLLPLWLGLAILVATLPTSVRAQAAAPSQSAATAAQPAQPEVVHLKDYSKPRSAFPNLLQPYKSQEIAPPNLGNSPRIDSLMKDGKIYLSIDDAVALALENNLDLDLARYNLNIADADLLRAKSGSSILGVNTGIVQNTPGGGVGGLGGTVGSGTGGTTVAAGGAGSGTRFGELDSRYRIAAHKLRSRTIQQLAARQEQHRVDKPVQPCTDPLAEHLHCGCGLQPGLSIRRLA